MSKKLLVLFCAFVLLLAVTSIADRDLAGENKPTLRSPGTGEQGEWNVKADSRAIVWDNGMAYVGIAASQYDVNIDPILDPIVADDFEFTADQLVNDVHWIGGYWNGPPDDGNFDWEIVFYNDIGDGTKPGAAIGTFLFPNSDVNETWIAGNPGASNFYSYSVNLPAALIFLAATKYWISIQGIGAYPPQSGIAYHEDPILLHEAVFKSNYFSFPNWTDGSIVFGAAIDLCFQLTYEEQCGWIPGDPHKMHYPQLPDEAGWDVNATEPLVLADDFECTQTGWIQDLHWWGSWKHGEETFIQYFAVAIAADIPASESPTGYSMPGETLREWYIYEYNPVPIDPPTAEGWYDPSIGLVIPDDHQSYYQYNVCFEDPAEWFWQDSGTIYWLSISAVVEDPTGYGYQWGWKSSIDHWNDDAVWAFWGELNWIDIWEPGSEIIDADTNYFWAAALPDGTFDQGFSSGTDFYGQGWYFYPMYDWWNIWFYDYPLDMERYKRIHIEVPIQKYDNQYPSYIDFAVNWSTDLWSSPTGDSMPPLPGVDEDLYIGREILVFGPDLAGYFIQDYVIPYYNPEWVSIDVRGYNYMIEYGLIIHECVGVGAEQSLDLAFVITGEPPPLDSGACCFNNGSCTYTDQNDCETVQGGTWQGAGTACEGDVNPANGIDDACETGPFGACCFSDGSCNTLSASDCNNQGGVSWDATQPCQGDTSPANGIDDACETGPFGACCFTDGSCVDYSEADCANHGGIWKGAGTACLGDINPPNGIDDACEEPTGACCFTDGSCDDLTRTDCITSGGDYKGDYSRCLGDADANGVDDACENGWEPGDPHKMHYPQLPDESGWDVNATYPLVLADDWRCSETGWIKDYHFWGSWRDDVVGEIVAFVLSIHSDIPADQSPTGYSMPGETLWEYEIPDFSVVPYDPPTTEGWYDPATGLILYDNHQHYYQYNIIIHDSLMWFWQEQDSIFWLNITAIVNDPTGLNPQWGWKSSVDHYNDDCVWAFWGDFNWQELYEPPAAPNPIINPFFVAIDETGGFVDGGGGDAFGEGWYYYPWYDWWNIWFYDHPFAPERYKTIILEFDLMPYAGGPSYVEIAVNWSTDLWSIEQPPTDSAPPLPGVPEDLYIGREILHVTDVPEGHFILEYTIPDYNPEWVSVDVRGFNFVIPEGFITHECVGAQSMDLSFVVTGETPCDCEPGNANGDVTINILDITYLIAYLYKGGPPPTPYRICSGDPNCDCVVNILDITYLISFLYKSGPPPCTCQQWLAACGPPLRK